MVGLSESLDSTSLEFERTLALEKFADAESQPFSAGGAATSAAGVGHSPVLSEFNHPILNEFNSDPGTNVTYDETMRLEQTDDFSSEYVADSGKHAGEDRAEREAERSTSEYTDTALTSGRDFPLLSEDILDRNGAMDNTQGVFSGSLQDQPESLHSDDRQYSAVESTQHHSDKVNELEENNQQQTDHNSARELRRYVSSRGGAVYPDGAASRQRTHSSLVPILLVCIALAAVLYFARNVIAAMNLPEPVVSVFCTVTGCELPAKKDIEQLELVRHQMFSHKTLDDVLVFSVDLVNRAKFPQPYPVLVVTMANGTGESVAFRKFTPAEYLEDDSSLKTLPAGAPVRIKFEIVDPGPEALSSELSFE